MKKLLLVLFYSYAFREVELYKADVELKNAKGTVITVEPSDDMNQYTILSDIDETNDLPIKYGYDGKSRRQESTTSLCNPEPKTDLDGAMAMLVAQIIGVDDQSCPIKSGVYTKPSRFDIDSSMMGNALDQLIKDPRVPSTVSLNIGDYSIRGAVDVEK